MNRLVLILACVTAVIGCGGSPETPSAPAATADSAAQPGPPAESDETADVTLGTMEMENFEMRFYDTLTTTAGGQAPTFYLQADSANSSDAAGMRLTRPNATIYGEDDQNVQLQAELGIIDERSETATLTGGVTAEVGEMHLTIDTLHYDNHERVAHSDSPVHLEGDVATIDAQSVRIQPKNGLVELFNVTGRIRLGEKTP